jgi:hypothetical protein
MQICGNIFNRIIDGGSDVKGYNDLLIAVNNLIATKSFKKLGRLRKLLDYPFLSLDLTEPQRKYILRKICSADREFYGGISNGVIRFRALNNSQRDEKAYIYFSHRYVAGLCDPLLRARYAAATIIALRHESLERVWFREDIIGHLSRYIM